MFTQLIHDWCISWTCFFFHSSKFIFTLFLLGCSFSCLSAFCKPFGKNFCLAYKRLFCGSSESLWSWNTWRADDVRLLLLFDHFWSLLLLFDHFVVQYASYVLTSVFWRVSSSEFDSCSLLQGNVKCKFTNLKSELNFKMNEIHLTYHYLPHFEKIVDST